MAQRTALVTGSAGFIGYHAARRLLDEGWRVIGLDAMTDYYDVALKDARHAQLARSPAFTAEIGRLEEDGRLMALFDRERPDAVIHLAAQAGVRYSLEAPGSYVEANLVGTFALLDAARACPPEHLLLASTSSVYGANAEMPYAETDRADHPLSFYAATKKANEAMAHAYAHLHGLPVTMFRFFTVYGPWGRPDMALFKFTRAILRDEAIEIYNHGEMRRDFTYVDDLVDGIVALIDAVPPQPGTGVVPVPGDSLSPAAPWRVVNIGRGQPVALMDFVRAVEEATGRTAKKKFRDMQPGDVPATWAASDLLGALTGVRPATPVGTGVKRFVEWYRDYYGI